MNTSEVTSKKPVQFVGSSQSDLRAFPKPVRHVIGHALYLAQTGGKHRNAKPLRGFGSAGVLEVMSDFDGDTYRAVYTVRFETTAYVLHAFQKKSRKGIATNKDDIDLVRSRLKLAENDYRSIQRGPRDEET